MDDDLGPIESHAFRPDPDDPVGCGYVEDGDMCRWPEEDHLASTEPGYQPDATYHQMLRDAASSSGTSN